MRIRLKNTTLRLDWLTALFPLCASFLGESSRMHLWLISLFAHEAAHLLTARAMQVPVPDLRLTPFGGFARMENPYAVPAAKLCAVAAAGPAANLLLLLSASTLCRWSLISPQTAADLIAVNATLMLFNLLPALPLDGGRILCAALGAVLSRDRTVRIGILLGRTLAVCLLAASAVGLVLFRRLNLSFPMAAVFLLAAAADERRAAQESQVHALLHAIQPITRPVRAELIAIEESFSPQTALRAARTDRATLFAVYRNGRFDHLTDDRDMLRRCLGEDASSR